MKNELGLLGIDHWFMLRLLLLDIFILEVSFALRFVFSSGCCQPVSSGANLFALQRGVQ